MKTKQSNYQIPFFIIGMILFTVVACLGWIKLQYGFNFIDEGYHMTESWRLAAGDHFLDDKITGALVHYTLINSLIFRIYPDISLLQMRHLQFIITLTSLLIFSIALFRQTRQYAWLPFVFSLFVFTGLDPNGMISNLYYQTYPHLFLVLFLSFMLFGFQSENAAVKKSCYLLSGFCLWLMTLSLLYLGLIIFAPIIIYFLSNKLKIKDYPLSFRDLLYVLSPFVVCWALFIAIFNKAYFLNLFNSLDFVLSMSVYSKGLITNNSEQIRRIMISMVFLSLFFAVIKKLHSKLFMAGCAVLSLIILLTINTPIFSFLVPYYDSGLARPMWFSSLLMAFVILFWMYTIRKYVLKRIFSKEEELSIILMVPFTICSCTMSIFSTLGPLAVCQSAIPAVAAIFCFFASQLKNTKYRHPIAILIFMLLLGPFYYTTARFDWDFTFWDVPPKYETVRIESGFGRGIYTNQIYCSLYNWLIANTNYFTRPNDYEISYVVSPMVHMITKRRPSLDDTYITFMVPNSYYEQCIEKMQERGREPRIAFIFERPPQMLNRSNIFPEKFFNFLASDDSLSLYVKAHMTPASTFKISDDFIIRCYVDYNLPKRSANSFKTP